MIAGAVPFVSAAYGFVAERFRFYVREVEIPVANLPPALDGLRITQLSDIHIGSYMPVAQVRRAVGMANELKRRPGRRHRRFCDRQIGPA